MATVLDIIDIVSRRVRDPNNTAHTRDQVRTVAEHAQRVVNAGTNIVTATQSFSTTADQQLYKLSTDVDANIVRMLEIRQGVRKIDFVSPRELQHTDTRWWRKRGHRLEVWSMIGRDLLVLHPGLEASVSVTLVYTKLTDAFPDENVTIELPDEDIPLLQDLTEILLLIRGRRLGDLKEVTQRFVASVAKRIGRAIA